jgi:tyrosinase
MAPPASKGSAKKSTTHKHTAHSGHATSGSAGPSRVTRQEVRHLSPGDLQNYRTAIATMQGISDNRGFQVIAGYHGVPGQFCEHGTPLFLPWHRAYMYHFEQFLRDRLGNTAIPWWDWTSGPSHTTGIPPAFADAKDDAGKLNPLFTFKVNLPGQLMGNTKRKPHNPATLPTTANVDKAINDRPEFADFTAFLEQIHNNVHVWCGGNMGVIPFAAFDPVFYSHHCMIDRIWYLWQIKNGINNIPSDLLNVSLPPFGMKVSDVLDISHLGYQYAVSLISG